MGVGEHSRGSSADIAIPRIALILSVLALLLIGLVMVYSSTSVLSFAGEPDPVTGEMPQPTDAFFRQLAFALLGIAAAMVVWRVIPHYFWSGNIVYVFWAIVVALLIMVAVLGGGGEETGSDRWVKIFESVGMQPSEFAKVVFLALTAKVVAQYQEGTTKLPSAFIQITVLVVITSLYLIYKKQPDMGTTVIILAGMFAILWIAGISHRLLFALAVLGVIGLIVGILGSGYRSNRMVYLDPWGDGNAGRDGGYNMVRSYFAIARGGLLGVGLGSSHEKYQYLFAPENDFIFAVLCEEMGMLGAVTVIVLFMTILIAGLSISATAPDNFGKLLVGGFSVVLAFQAFLNIGCAIGVFPTTGKPLPFISQGGSSMVTSLAMVGIILSVSRAAEKPSVYERRRANLRLLYHPDADGADDLPSPRGEDDRVRHAGAKGAFAVASRGDSIPSSREGAVRAPRNAVARVGRTGGASSSQRVSAGPRIVFIDTPYRAGR